MKRPKSRWMRLGINRTSTHRDDERKRAGDCHPRREGNDPRDSRDVRIGGLDQQQDSEMYASDFGVALRSMIVIALVALCLMVICDLA